MVVHIQHAQWELHVTEVDFTTGEELWAYCYQHVYRVLCENGHVDELYEQDYTSATLLEMDDHLWDEHSGWGIFKCDACEFVHEERCYQGLGVECPRCATIEVVPEGVELERSHVE